MKTELVLEYLNKYPVGELIDINQLYQDISKSFEIERRIFNVQIARIAKQGAVKRFKRGLYYRVVETPFGITLPNLQKELNKEYVGSVDEPLGFYGAESLLNQLGITDLEPNKITIYTLKQKTSLWTKNMNVRFKRAPLELNQLNYDYLKILYLIKDIDDLLLDKDFLYEKIAQYIKTKNMDMLEMLVLSDFYQLNETLPHLAKVARVLIH